MAVQEPGECQGQHSRYHWPPAITPEALSWVRLRSHIRPKRNASTARYRYLSVDNVANLCCGTHTGEYFHPHLDSQNFHGSRLLGSRVATIPFPINRNVHFSFLLFFFSPPSSRTSFQTVPYLSFSFSQSEGREKKIKIFIFFEGNIITQDLSDHDDSSLNARSNSGGTFQLEREPATDSSHPKEGISVCSDVIGISIRTFWRRFIQQFGATGVERWP